MKKIMIIGAGEFQVPLIKECKSNNYYTIVTDLNPEAEGFKFSDIALNIDTLDKELTLKKAREYNVDAIITTSDYPVRVVAYVCEKLALKGLSVRASEICTNKFLLRECLKEHNVENPSYWIVNEKREIEGVMDKLKFPVVLKPVDSSASRGVIKINEINDLFCAYDQAMNFSKSGKVIIEEFIEGPEYSVECITQNGKTYCIAITEKTTAGEPYFVEERHVIPANLTETQEELIIGHVISVIEAIGLDNSASHTEIKLTSKGPRIIEIGARLGGDYITSDLVPLSTGVNMLDNIIRLALSQPLKIQKKLKLFSGIQFITSYNYENILKNDDKIKNDDKVVKFFINVEKENNKLTNSLDRFGYYICVTEDREELYKSLNKTLLL